MSLLDRMIGEADACRKSNDNNNFHIAKADEDQRLVFGWALVSERTDGETIIDHQGDIVDPDELEKGAYEYVLKFRDAGEEHIGTLRKKAKMVESCVFTPEKMKALGIPEGTVPVGWWIGFHVDDDRTWELIKNGTYNMFSIEGKAVREPVNEPVAKNAFDEWLEDHLDADEETQRRMKEKLDRPRTVAKSFSEIVEKFNPYHDSKGRFTSGSGGNYASFTYAPGKSKAHDNAIARERERAAQRSNAASGPKPMTEDEYLGSKGLSSPVSDWTLDKVRIPHGETDRQKKKRIAEGKKEAEEYQRKREQAKQEYQEKVKNGELRDKTTIERMIDRANGHPDNPSTQAARRIAEKRGIDWRTGKPLQNSSSAGGGVKAIRVTSPDGTVMSYRDQGNGIITEIDDVLPKNTNNLSIKQISERAKKMGYKVETFDDKQLKQHDAAVAEDRKQTNAFLDHYDVRDRGKTYRAPRKGWKGH